jgi:hypothetical protein
MPSYLTFAEYSARSRIRASLITQAGSAKVEVFLSGGSSKIRARLVKRYAVDFQDPGTPPEVLLDWLTAIVDRDVQEYVGGNPEGREDEWIVKRADRAEEEIKEAANAETGLFELPLRNTDPLGASAVNLGGPIVVEYLEPINVWDVLVQRRCT